MRESSIALVGLLLRVVLGVFVASDAFALVDSVSPGPGLHQVAAGQPTAVPVVWLVHRDELGACGNTVSSAKGIVRGGNANGPVLYTVPTTLSQTRVCVLGNDPGTQFTFTETALIPADVVQRAQKMGFTTLDYGRAFDDGTGAGVGGVSLPIVAASMGALSVFRESLQFDDGGAVRVLPRGKSLHALAEIAYNGSGLLQGYWEIADPASTSGEPLFRTLTQVREYLAPGGDKKVFKSPTLPSDMNGLYLVRLRVTDPALAFEAPVLRYFVADQGSATQPTPAPLTSRSPAPRALLASDTQFSWEAVPGAKAYRLDLYDAAPDRGPALPELGGADATVEEPLAGGQKPSTGMLVNGNQTSLALSKAARLHLQPGRRYLWRVQAIGADGGVMATSPARELRTP